MARVAAAGVGLVAQQAYPSAQGKLDRMGERALGRRRLQVGVEDLRHFRGATGAGGDAAGLGRAEVPQVQIVYPCVRQAAPEQGLGEARPTRGGDGANIDQKLDARLLQPGHHLGQRGPLIAYGGDGRG